MRQGKKYDTDKLRWDLLLWKQVNKVVEVLTFGAKKYGENNWKEVENGGNRYFAAAVRHLVAWRQGETVDKESGVHHLAHAICCLLFLMWRDDETISDKYSNSDDYWLPSTQCKERTGIPDSERS